MKFGVCLAYHKGDRVWVRGWRSCGVATVTRVHPFRRTQMGTTTPVNYSVEFDLRAPMQERSAAPVRSFRRAADMRPATEAESQRSKDAVVAAHIKALRGETL